MVILMVIPDLRERLPGEITLVSAEQSHTNDDNEEKFAAAHAIDMDWETMSHTIFGSDGTTWFKAKLDKLHCIEQVIWYYEKSNPDHSWTCTSDYCSTCTGVACSFLTLTVSSEAGSTDGLTPRPACRYGDTVIIKRLDKSWLKIAELVIVGKKGKIAWHGKKICFYSRFLDNLGIFGKIVNIFGDF